MQGRSAGVAHDFSAEAGQAWRRLGHDVLAARNPVAGLAACIHNADLHSSCMVVDVENNLKDERITV